MFRSASLLLAGALALPAQASVVITGTRVIYPAQQASVNVQLHNSDSTPSLIQSWLDSGDAASTPDAEKVPFIISPPVFRMDPRSGQTLRIIHTGEPLPEDRESLFYLNVLDIPPKPEEAVGEDGEPRNYLQIAIRNRLKFFYRPERLSPEVQDAYALVRWQLAQQTGPQGEHTVLRADNPTPYYITFSRLTLNHNDAEFTLPEAGMIAPFSQLDFELGQALPPTLQGVQRLSWSVIDDYGAHRQGDAALQ